MELSEKIIALESEKKQYINIIDGLNAEKIARERAISSLPLPLVIINRSILALAVGSCINAS